MKTATLVGLLIVLTTFTGCGQSGGSTGNPVASALGLHQAVVMGDLEVVKQYIEAGSDLDVPEPSRASSPLITAAAFGKTEVAKVLIQAGADLDYANKDGSTALHTAAFFCRTEIVKALLESGADKSLQNKAGSTALESVEAPFEQVKGIYEQFQMALAPAGLILDYEQIRKTRPHIAEMLR